MFCSERILKKVNSKDNLQVDHFFLNRESIRCVDCTLVNLRPVKLCLARLRADLGHSEPYLSFSLICILLIVPF